VANDTVGAIEPPDKEELDTWNYEHHERLAALGWPPALVKASLDPWDYLAVLKSGHCVRFTHARDLGGGWLSLEGLDDRGFTDGQPFGYPCPRGLQVRLAEVVAVADAPGGI
jgi:hypothetical protein